MELKVIFNFFDIEKLRIMLMYESTNEAWTILENQQVGTISVELFKLEILKIKFEILKMNEDENVYEFSWRN